MAVLPRQKAIAAQGIFFVLPMSGHSHEQTGNWIINDNGERSTHIHEEAGSAGVLVNVQSISTKTIDNTDYVRIQASGIPVLCQRR